PALALAAAAGLAAAWNVRGRSRAVTAIAGVLLLWGVWRVGVEGPSTRPRLFGVPQAVTNAMDDLAFARGATDQREYLARFDRGEGGKFSLLAIERLAGPRSALAAAGRPRLAFCACGEGDKFSLLAIERLVARVDQLTSPADRAFVFGFAGGGALVKAKRQSA